MCKSDHKDRRNATPQEHVCPKCGGVNCVGQILTTISNMDAVFGGYCSNCNIEFVGDRILVDYGGAFKGHP